MFSYLRRDHRNKDDKERHPNSPKEKGGGASRKDRDLDTPTNASNTVLASKLPKENTAESSDTQPSSASASGPDLLPPLSAPPDLATSIADSMAWSDVEKDGLQPSSAAQQQQPPPPPPKPSPKVSPSMSLSRGISRKVKKKEKPPKVENSNLKPSSLSLSLGRPETSPNPKGNAAATAILGGSSPPSKPASPWKLSFGTSKDKDRITKSSTVSAGGMASSKTPQPAPAPSEQNNGKQEPDTRRDSTITVGSIDTQRQKSPGIHSSQTWAQPPAGTHELHTKGSRRLNILNPMALLARRRSSHHHHHLNSPSKTDKTDLPALPDDYDPRIRGQFIHDFSTPRPRPPPITIDRSKEGSIEKGPDTAHAHEIPLPPSAGSLTGFGQASTPPPIEIEGKEKGEGEEEDENDDEEGYVNSILPSPRGVESPRVSSSTAREQDSVGLLPSDQQGEPTSQDLSQESLSTRSKSSSRRSGVPKYLSSNASRFSFDLGGGEPSAQERLLEEKHKEREAELRAKEMEERANNPNYKRDSESTFDEDGEFDDFDYDAMLEGDDGCYEERIPGVNVDPEEENDNPPANLNQPAAAQQRQSIYDDDGFSATPFAKLAAAGRFSPTPASKATNANIMLSPVSSREAGAPADFAGMIPIAGLPRQSLTSEPDQRASSVPSIKNSFLNSPPDHSPVDARNSLPFGQQGQTLNASGIPGVPGMKDDTSQMEAAPQAASAQEQPKTTSQTPQSGNENRFSLSQPIEDDLYFDDGFFGDLGSPPPAANDDTKDDTTKTTFDESIFDDENSYLYDRKKVSRAMAQRQAAQPQMRSQTQAPDLPAVAESPLKDEFNASLQNHDDDIVPLDEQLKAKEPVRPHNTLKENTSSRAPLNDHLDPYSSALAEAVNKAAAAGRFERNSISSDTEDDDSNIIATTGASTPPIGHDDPNHTVHPQDDKPDHAPDFWESGYEDGADEDDSDLYDNYIAAANSEALENDEDGLYGLEFGFYPTLPPGAETQDGNQVYGGYFGEHGINLESYVQGKNGTLIQRSHSGRATDFQEPSLTPITERSEWSNRNSIISLQHPAATMAANANAASSSLPSQASFLSHAGADAANSTTPHDDPEMSFSALMKLRRTTFNGSNSSLRSNSRPSSPSGHAVAAQKAVPSSSVGAGCLAVPNGQVSHQGGVTASSPLNTSFLATEEAV